MKWPVATACLCTITSAISIPFSHQQLSARQSPNPAQTLHSPIFSCSASSWPQTTLGSLIKPQLPDSELQEIISQIDPANIEASILKLVSFGTRHTLSSQTDPERGIGAARDWIADEFRRFAEASDGHMTVEVVGYEQQPDGARILFPVNISDVVATLRGSEDPDRYYVVSGHYDTRCTDPNDYECDAPGADDDASGVAISLELARIMATHRPKATIVFAAVAGEEQGLYGAEYLAQTYANSSTNVAGMFTNDIVGSSTGDDGTSDPFTIRLFAQGIPLTENATVRSTRLTIGGENDSPARQLARLVHEVAQNEYTNMTVAVIYRLDRYLRGGDHRPFLEAGFAAARFTEPNENFAHQHQDVRVEDGMQYGDLPEFCDFEYIARVGRVNAAALWSLANAPGVPTNVYVNTTALDNNSQFVWDEPLGGSGGGVLGYEIVWRPTSAPFWTEFLDVGDVNTFEIDLSKDNVVFGIRSVGEGGYKSPAVFPFPLPAGS